MTQTEQLKANEHEQLEAIGRERLKKLVPKDAKAVIVAELHEDESDSMRDYFGYRTVRTVILGFSAQTKDLFSEMRKYSANFEETAYLADERREYEHREKYAGGAGYYLGKSNYSGWIVKKEKNYGNREGIINAFAFTAGEESNICVKSQSSGTKSEVVSGEFLIVNYSDKAIAVFGDTRLIKDQLKKSGGRFNPFLTHDNEKKPGWVFSKNHEHRVRKLLNN